MKLDSNGTAALLLAGNERHNNEASMTFMRALSDIARLGFGV